MIFARVVLLLALSLGACVTDEGEGGTEGSSGTTTGEDSPQYRACAVNDDCDDPTPFCFAQLGVCMKACAAVETCPAPPSEGSAAPVCALMEFDAQPYQVCLLSCGEDDDCPEGLVCGAVAECEDCGGSVCRGG